MRQPTIKEYTELKLYLNLKDEVLFPLIRNIGVVDDYRTAKPGYSGKLFVVVLDDPDHIKLIGVDGAQRLYTLLSTY